MDWIEKLFGISPDGGSGSAELAFLAVIAVIVILGSGGLRVFQTWIRNRHQD
jgi:hypothetical protein